MRKVEGYDYLYQRGGKYLVRMQVPEPLRDLLGKGELKKSLGGDLSQAVRNRHKIIAEFQNVMGSVLPRAPVVEPSSISHDAIDTAVYDHFQRLALRAREAALSPDHANPRSRQGRMEGLRQHIDLTLDSLDADDCLLVGDHADLLISEQGWSLPETDGRYKYLCQRVMRARLAAFRAELKRLEGDFSEASKVDPDFGPSKPKPKSAHTIGALIASFNKVREAAWATSTAKNYVIITRVLEEVCGKDTPLTEIDEDFCRRVLEVLQQLPSNYQKKALTKGKPIPEVIKIAAAEGMPLLQPATVKMHLDKLGAFVRYGRDKGWIMGNPMALVQVFDPIDPSDKRDPFSIGQLNKIFALEPWVNGAQRPDGRPSRYWAPLIALFSGARLGETVAGVPPTTPAARCRRSR